VVVVELKINGISRGEVELSGPALLPWANVCQVLVQIMSEEYTRENPPTDSDPGNDLDVRSDFRLKPRPRGRSMARATR
jgi:hypothetical protein